MTLNSIDISRYQAGENIASTGADVCIVGLTFGSVGVNPYAADEVARARAAGMLLGLYHIRAGDGPTPQQEADNFLSEARKYMDGKTVLFLDWEECTLSDTAWAAAWIRYVIAQTGIVPVIYMSASVSLAYDWAAVRALNVGLWVAQYPYNTCSGFAGVAWTPPATSWPFLMGWQYCGTGGNVGGLSGMDLSVFYITAKQWIAYATPAGATVTIDAGIVTPIPQEWLDMASKDDVKQAIREVLAENLSATPAAAKAGTLAWAIMNGRNHAELAHNAAAANTDAVAAVHAGVVAVPSAVLNQTFKTAAGVTTNVPGLLDAIHTQPPAPAVPFTPAQASAMASIIAEALQAALPASTIHALAAQLTK